MLSPVDTNTAPSQRPLLYPKASLLLQRYSGRSLSDFSGVITNIIGLTSHLAYWVSYYACPETKGKFLRLSGSQAPIVPLCPVLSSVSANLLYHMGSCQSVSQTQGRRCLLPNAPKDSTNGWFLEIHKYFILYEKSSESTQINPSSLSQVPRGQALSGIA